MDLRGLRTRFLQFVAVGCVATSLQYIVLGVLVKLGWLPPPAASAVGYAASTLLSYFLNYKYTFDSSGPHSVVLTKFVLNAMVGMTLSYLLMSAFAKYTGLHYFVSQVLVTGVVLVWNFSVSSLWTFQKAAVREGPQSHE